MEVSDIAKAAESTKNVFSDIIVEKRRCIRGICSGETE